MVIVTGRSHEAGRIAHARGHGPGLLPRILGNEPRLLDLLHPADPSPRHRDGSWLAQVVFARALDAMDWGVKRLGASWTVKARDASDQAME